jgi:hypothetical protein
MVQRSTSLIRSYYLIKNPSAASARVHNYEVSLHALTFTNEVHWTTSVQNFFGFLHYSLVDNFFILGTVSLLVIIVQPWIN